MQKTNLWLLGVRRVWINWEIGIDIYTLLYVKQITNKDLLYSTGNSTRYSVMAYMEKKSKIEWIYVYVELDMEQQTGSKQEKDFVKAVYCHPAYLTYMQSTS